MTHISAVIILRTWEFGETDLLVSFFASDRGRLKGVAKGARKSRKRFANCLDLFSLVNLEFRPSERVDLHFLNSGRLVHAFPGLRSDFLSLSMASYMVELTEILFPLGVADKEMFELLKNSFLALSNGNDADEQRVLFEAKAMALGGYGINLDSCCKCGRPYQGEGRAVFKLSKGGIACLRCDKESSRSPGMGPETLRLLKTIQSRPWKGLEGLHLSTRIIEEMAPVLKSHIGWRVGRRLKTARYLE